MANNRKGTPAFMQGNEACAEAAITAGCRFFAGYPITPSTEIAEECAKKLPLVGGAFIQMEDEIASMAAVIGGSLAGAKSMTATSGPGFSLMQENIGYAYMAEVPCVVVNVMRGGPSTGLPTLPSQSDVMQTRWGTHGDYTAIVVAPGSVQEVFDLTIHAFNCAEKFHTPVIIAFDEIIGHMREKLFIPEAEDIHIIDDPFPSVPPEFYKPFNITPDYISEFVSFGEGYRFNVTGLTHDRMGFPTSVPWEIKEKLMKLRKKIHVHRRDIIRYTEHFLDDARYVVVSYGLSARSAMSAVMKARAKGFRVGLLKLQTIWPFPGQRIKELSEQCDGMLMAEMNMGQLVRELDRYTMGNCKVMGAFRYDGHPIEPDEIYNKLLELRDQTIGE